MGPVRQNQIQRTVSLFICVYIALCTIVAHNIAQNRPDSFPPYPPDNHHISDDVYLREGGNPWYGLFWAYTVSKRHRLDRPNFDVLDVSIGYTPTDFDIFGSYI